MSEVTSCASCPEAVIRYHRSYMVLWSSTDASYLLEDKARRRVGAVFFLSSHPNQPRVTRTNIPPPNGVFHVLSKIINTVMISAMEAEVGATFLVAKDAVSMCVALEEMDHKQPPTPMQVNSLTAISFINNTIGTKI